jgi:hypothetical protein
MYKKADLTGLPEGTDWNTLFEFSDDGNKWTKPMRIIRFNPAEYYAFYSEDTFAYKIIRPATGDKNEP